MVSDTGEQWSPKIAPERTAALFALHPMLHLNASEARALSGRSDLDDAMRALHQRTQAPVIATLGRHGARVLAGDGALLTVPGQPVERVADTIGAGDAHAGAVLLGLSRGLSLPDAVALGNRVSAQVVQTAGATLSDEALSRASITRQEIDAIAVTYAPGLIGAVLVGVNFAKAAAYSLGVPLVPVHHIRGHIAANYLAYPDLEPPFLCLVVSGGHTLIVDVQDYTKFHIMGTTRDDAAGECFDKIARVIGMPYPGGAALDKTAQTGDETKYPMPHTKLSGNPLDMSFSGLKTAVMNTVRKEPKPLSQEFKNNLARAFVDSVTDVLVTKCLKALKKTGNKSLVAAGGVSANKQLRTRLTEACRRRGVKVFFPPQALCTDNGAMIAAAAGAHLAEIKDLKNKKPDGFSIKPRWSLEHPNDND